MSDLIATLAECAHCKPADLFNISPDLPAEVLAAIAAYLEPFAAPQWPNGKPPESADFLGLDSPRCLKCGTPQGGIFGAFSWGIAHGEGACSCGWPARAYHSITDSQGEIVYFNVVLQYHPDHVRNDL